MCPPHSVPRVAFAALMALGVVPATSASENLPSDGIAVGRWLLKPYVVVGVESNSNPFYRSESDVDLPPESEIVTRFRPTVSAVLPFRESALTFDFDGTRYGYSETEALDGEWALDGAATLDLRFSTGDALVFRGQRIEGVATTTAFDPGGETVFRGEKFAYTNGSVALRREVPGRRGWNVEAVHEVLDFDEGVEAAFFDFRGWSVDAEYREPFGGGFWGTVGWEARRYDNYRANRPEEVGIAYRVESSGIGWLGAKSVPGRPLDWSLRVGRADLDFEGESRSTYKGFVGEAGAGVNLGRGLSLRAEAQWRPYPSAFFDNDYYLSGNVRLSLQRSAPTGTVFGAALQFGGLRYDRAVPDGASGWVLRRDQLAGAELYATVPIRRWVGVRLGASHQRRTSTYPTSDYNVTSVFGGLTLGWF